MKVIEMGNLELSHPNDGNLPKVGIIIEATEYEIRNMPLNVLYNKVKVSPLDDKGMPL